MKYLPFLFMLFLVSCDKEFDNTTTTEENPRKEIYVESSLTLVVTNERGEPIESFGVIDGNTYHSNSEGIIRIPSLLLNEKGQNFHVSAEGYFDVFRSVIPEIGRELYMEVSLRADDEDRVFDASVGAEFIDRRMTINIPPGALIDGNDQVFTGQARVRMRYISESLYASDYKSATNPIIQKDGQPFALIPMGGVDIQFESLGGEPLQLSDDHALDIQTKDSTTPVPFLDEMQIYQYERSTSDWIELRDISKDQTGTGKLVNTQIKKSGVYIWAETVEVHLAKFRVMTSDGVPLNNAFIMALSGYYNPLGAGHTDSEGWIRLPAYKNAKTEMGILVECNPIIYQQEFYISEPIGDGIYSEAEAFRLDSENFNVITGQVVDCNGNSISTAMVSYSKRGPIYRAVNDDGIFQIVLPSCISSQEITVVDFDQNTKSKPRTVVINDDVEMNQVVVCEVEYFINIDHQGSYHLFDGDQGFNSARVGSIYEGNITASGQGSGSEATIHFSSDNTFKVGSYEVQSWNIANDDGSTQVNDECNLDCEGVVFISEINSVFAEGSITITNPFTSQTYRGVFRLPIQ